MSKKITVKADLSLGQRMDMVNEAVWRATETPMMDMPSSGYAVAIFDDYVILCYDDKFWQVSYTIVEDKVEIAAQATWQEVEQHWVAVKMGLAAETQHFAPVQPATPGKKAADTLVLFGGEIKALGNGKVGGYLVRFTDAEHPDLEGDFFTVESDLDIHSGDAVTLYYNHGFDPVLKNRKLGKGSVDIRKAGVWVEAQLQMRDEYEKAIYAMAEKGKLGWSSGTLGYLVEREPDGKAMWVKSWPLGKDASLTPTPAAGPILTAVQPMKSWAEATQSLQAPMQQAAGDAATHSATAKVEKAVDDTKRRLLLELEHLVLER
jgi:hypothetical protein